jgi:redox-sensing transcriptional repressor
MIIPCPSIFICNGQTVKSNDCGLEPPLCTTFGLVESQLSIDQIGQIIIEICNPQLIVIELTALNEEAEAGSMTTSTVPDIVVGRLPLYLRSLTQMADEGSEITSSQELGNRLGISSAQIRKDLSQFGEFGKQGTGYNIRYLAEQIQRILNVQEIWDVALVGAGDLGRAVAHYGGFLDRGFRITMVFDNNPQVIGQQVGPFVVQDSVTLIESIKRSNIRVAMLAVPAAHAQEVSDQLIEAGIKAILCYAPTPLVVPEDVKVGYIDPVLHLQHMTYYLR